MQGAVVALFNARVSSSQALHLRLHGFMSLRQEQMPCVAVPAA